MSQRYLGESIGLSLQQKAIREFLPGQPEACVVGALGLASGAEYQAIRGALAAQSLRHEVLRTTYTRHAMFRDPRQVVSPEPQVWLQTAKAMSAAGSDGVELARARVDSSSGPVLSAVHFATDTGDRLVVAVPAQSLDEDGMLRLLCGIRDQLEAKAESGPLELQYGDYAEWQRQLGATDIGAQGRQFWQRRAQEDSSSMSARSLRRSGGRAEQRSPSWRARDERVERAVMALAERIDCTKQEALFSVWVMFAARLYGAEQMVCWYPAQERPAELEGVLGRFERRLPVSARLELDRTIAANLEHVRRELGECLSWAESFDEIEYLRLRGALGEVLGYRWLSRDTLEAGVLTLGIEPVEDLKLEYREQEECGEISLLAPRGAYSDRTLRMWTEQFVTFLHGLSESGEGLLGAIQLSSGAERDVPQTTFARTSEPSVEKGYSGHSLHGLVEAAVASSPDAAAVQVGGTVLSYAYLDRSANRVAHRLIDCGVSRGGIVGLFAERSVELLVGILGILKAGAAYVPLDPTYPDERIEEMVIQARLAQVLMQAEPRTGSRWTEGLQLLPMGLEGRAWSDDDGPCGVQVAPQDLAYVIFTSGSTGKPKGVMVSHASAVRSTLARWAFYPERVESFLLLSSFSFDSSVAGLFWTLGRGGKLCLPPDGLSKDAIAVARIVEDCGVSHLLTLPTFYDHVLAELNSCERLTTAIVAGERCDGAVVDRHHRKLSGVHLVNEYGPTEGTVWCTAWRTTGGEAGVVPIGAPIAGMEAYVLDEELQLVPVGARGELYIGGGGLARGYVRSGAQTAMRFMPHPFSRQGGERLYRTGDWVRWTADGSLLYEGRRDRQVKLRGYRIELGEVEAKLERNAAVERAVVRVVDEGEVGARLVAYIQPSHVGRGADDGRGHRASLALGSELRDALADELPEFMLPSQWMMIERWPLTPSGKLDVNALPEPVENDRRPYREPSTPTERLVANIWEKVLKVGRVGLDDNFFELGGHSLSAVQVVAELRRSLDAELGLASVFEHPELRALAKRVHDVVESGSRSCQPPLERAAREGRVPLSHAQQRQWVLWELDRDSSAYNTAAAVRLAGQLDREALTYALDELIHRHEPLRTRVGVEGGEAFQVIDPVGSVVIHWEDLSDAEDSEREPLARRRVSEQRHRAFDLERGPLLRVKVLRLSEREHVVSLVQHHIASDAWSMRVLVGELVELYRASVQGREAALKELPVQYADYAVWQRKWLEAGELARQLEYWRDRLGEEHPVLELPGGRPRPAKRSHRSARSGFEVPARVVQSLRQLGEQQGATLFMVLLAAWKVLLHRHTGQEDLRVGVPHANRSRAELEGLIGFFVNTHVLRTQLKGSDTFLDVLNRVREASLGAQVHQDLPFEQLVEALNPGRSLSHHPLFQVVHNHEKHEQEVWRDLPGLKVKPFGGESDMTQFDLVLNTAEVDIRLLGSVVYATDLFDVETAEQLAGHYCRLLEGIAQNPEERIGRLSLLSGTERERLLSEWNHTREDDLSEQCLHQLIEAQAERTPDAMAVAFGGEWLSYRELNARANQLARKLQREGVGPDERVGIFVDRSLEMVVGLLGVLKADGAYVPLDPEYPSARLKWMLEDSAPRLVLSQERMLERLPNGSTATPTWCLDRDWQEVAQFGGSNAKTKALSDNLAYVLYTSGSTGKPKGVAVSRRGLSNYVRWAQKSYALDGLSGSLLHSSLSFDLTVTSLWPPLCAGGRVECAAIGSDAMSALLEGVHRLSGAQLFKLTPAHARILSEERDEPLRGVAVLGGEALSVGCVAALREMSPELRLINEYGPTETVVGCCVFDATASSFEQTSVPIGHAIANLQLHVLDAELEPAPAGMVGELYIGGLGLARGYVNRAALTSERFVAHPYGEHGERLYRTGDLARRRADGALEYVGRADQQVKIRGYRIELGEIESRLLEHERVRQAVVLVRSDVSGERRLVAYVVTNDPAADEALPLEGLREHAARTLPGYMVPGQWLVLRELPLTSNGKVDRRKLAELSLPRRSVQSDEPQTDVERQLAAIWQEVLGVERVLAGDNFFELGGDSILAMKVVGRARRIGLGLIPLQIFEAQTLRALANCVTAPEPRARPSNGEPDLAVFGARSTAR